MKKPLWKKLTTRSRSKAKTARPVYHLRRGIETKIQTVHPALDEWGVVYQSIFRTAVNGLQNGSSTRRLEMLSDRKPLSPSKSDLLKEYQKRFNIQWAWSDSILTDAQGTVDQLKESKKNLIEQLKTDLKSGYLKCNEEYEYLEKALWEQSVKTPCTSPPSRFKEKLMGLSSKIYRLKRKEKKLNQLEKTKRFKVCFGSKKLFKAQYNLKENGYDSHLCWLDDWQKSRSGNFYSVGKGSVVGNNPVTKVFHVIDDDFCLKIQLPRCLLQKYGEWIEVPFKLSGARKHDLLYALVANKPITVQVFRREHKQDNWYIHLTTYVQDVPTVHTEKNGCLGIDFNAESIDVIYIKRDGNPGLKDGQKILASYPINDHWSTGQRKSHLRNISASIVSLAERNECAIGIENLDFSQKKAAMRHRGDKKYNRMLSGLVYDGLRAALVSRAEKQGVRVIFVNPAFTSVIGMVKYMARYGLNSATSAAMVIARRAMGFSERVPQCWLNLLFSSPPEDCDEKSWKLWRKISSLLKKYAIRRNDLFRPLAVTEVLSKSMALPKSRRLRTTSNPGFVSG